jgi:hypothetical protein
MEKLNENLDAFALPGNVYFFSVYPKFTNFVGLNLNSYGNHTTAKSCTPDTERFE